MERHKLSNTELLEHLEEQISFLLSSCISYDKGNIQEAKRMANCLRILLHDTKSSKSLLGQLGAKKKRFFNTCKEKDPENLAPHLPLISFRFNNNEGYRPWIIPSGTPEKPPKRSKVNFSDWWNMPVIVTSPTKPNRISFCRREIILNVANTDGGSHVDPSIERKYAALSRWNAIGVVTIQNEIEKPINNPILPCIRQITHELMLFLFIHYPNLFSYEYEMQLEDKPPKDNKPTGNPTDSSLAFPDILK